MYGGSNNSFIGSKIGGCSDNEYKTHFSLWCLLGSPLLIGCDIRTSNQTTKNMLLNPDLIAINQDIESRGAYRIKPEPQWFHTEDVFMLVKVLTDGDVAIGFFNLSGADDRAIYMKLVSRTAQQFLCIDCLRVKLDCGREPIEKLIRYFRSSGNCVLFR
jgi:hypothetical protein